MQATGRRMHVSCHYVVQAHVEFNFRLFDMVQGHALNERKNQHKGRSRGQTTDILAITLFLTFYVIVFIRYEEGDNHLIRIYKIVY